MSEVGWLAGLPAELASQARILRGFLVEASIDPRIRALQVQGSIGRGTADRHSDVDLGMVVAAEAWPAISGDLPDLVRRVMGAVVDEHYHLAEAAGEPELFRAWAQLDDGVQLDLLVLPSTRTLGSGRDGRTLLDRDGLLPEVDHPRRDTDAESVAEWSYVCWHALTEVAKYAERGLPVVAAEWLCPAREATISCWAAAHGVEYAGMPNVAAAALGRGCPWPEGLEMTYPRPEAAEVRAAMRALADLQSRAEQLLGERFGVSPRPLAAWVRSRLGAVR